MEVQEMIIFGNKLKKDHKLYKELTLERFILQEADGNREEIDKKIDEVDRFVEYEYARDIFEKYNKKCPKLICNETGEIVSWREAFGNDFDILSKNLRHSLVGLMEGGGRYRFR